MEILEGGDLGCRVGVAPRGLYLSDGSAAVNSLHTAFLASRVKTNQMAVLCRVEIRSFS